MAGLSQAEYDTLPGDPSWLTDDGPSISKAHVIAFARMRARIDTVYSEAARRANGNK